MQYDRTYSQAMSHLAAGNWEQTIVLLRPLMSQYPTEKKLYLAVLRAATQNFGDIDMDNTTNRTIASEAWDKLVRLNGVSGEMIRYGSRRYEKHREELNKQRARILAWNFSGPTPASADRPHPVRGRPLYSARTAAWQSRPDCTPPP